MFGTMRFVLALLVVALHLALVPYVGEFAVAGFFVLSGYLMTLVMHRTYGYSIEGFRRFALNRALRIFPPYWAAVVLAAVAVLTVGPGITARMLDAFVLPTSPSALLENVALINMDWTHRERLLPHAWALSVELAFYLLIGLGLGRSRRAAIVWACASAAVTVWTWAGNMPFTERYYTLTAGSLPFSLGAVVYHYREAFTVRRPRLVVALLVVLFVANAVVAIWKGTGHGRSFYTNFVICTALVAVLANVPWKSRIDRLLGDLSYPVYLLHAAVAALVYFVAPMPKGPMFFAVCLPFILAASVALHYLVVVPVERARERVKRGQPVALSPARQRGSTSIESM